MVRKQNAKIPIHLGTYFDLSAALESGVPSSIPVPIPLDVGGGSVFFG